MAEGWKERNAKRTNLTGEATRAKKLVEDPAESPSGLLDSLGEFITEEL
tara:strand:- start:109 stop:255 length:147 start_codon:yes stop_codon:yes gene_type:complete